MDARSSQTTQDQRRSAREDLEASVRLTIDARELEGFADNLSAAGIMLFTDQPLTCSVEVGEGDERKSYRGTLVRVQRMGDATTGLAIEFQDEP